VVGALLVSFEGRSPLAAYGIIVDSTFGSPS